MHPSSSTVAFAAAGVLASCGLALRWAGRRLRPQLVALDRRGMTVAAVIRSNDGRTAAVFDGPAGQRTTVTRDGAVVAEHTAAVTVQAADPDFERRVTGWLDAQTPLDLTMHYAPAASGEQTVRTIHLDAGDHRIIVHSRT